MEEGGGSARRPEGCPYLLSVRVVHDQCREPPVDYMGRALQLAERALGIGSPNPAVGALLVQDGRIVGEGWTQPPGQAHAEIGALRAAGDEARGATLYVTL